MVSNTMTCFPQSTERTGDADRVGDDDGHFAEDLCLGGGGCADKHPVERVVEDNADGRGGAGGER